jgi:hypothetical protein
MIMQKRYLVVIFSLLAIITILPAQITITNASFPAAGDSLKTATDFNPVGITVTSPGGPFTWDYSTLNPSNRQVTVFQPAANGSAFATFPTADLVTIDDLGAEAYFDVTTSAFSSLGISGSNGGGLPFATDIIFSPPLPEFHAPLTFPNVFNSATSFGFAIAVSEIPGGILDSLGVPSGLFDSIRIKLTITRNDFVDAFGTLAIPGGTYNVLREKRTDYADTRLEIHVPFLGWQDVTDLLPVAGFGKDTTITYNYLSNTAKEPIAVATMDTTGLVVQEVEFKDLGVPSAVDPLIASKPEVVVSPNPASDQATFELKNIEPGKHVLQLFDAVGQRILVIELSSDRQSIPLNSFNEGTYVYRLFDGKNKMLTTGKFLKINQK